MALPRGGARAGREIRTPAAVLLRVSGGVATLTLGRPGDGNRLDARMTADLAAALETCDLSAEVRVVALRGAGRDFCLGAGGGERGSSGAGRRGPTLGAAGAGSGAPPGEAADLGEVLVALRALPKVTVAIVQGRALGGGFGLAAACDLVVARAGSAFGACDAGRGAVPAAVMPLLCEALGVKRAFDVAATGRILDADEALAAGLVCRVLPGRAFDAAITKMLTALARRSATALALAKRRIHECGGDALAAARARRAR